MNNLIVITIMLYGYLGFNNCLHKNIYTAETLTKLLEKCSYNLLSYVSIK